jgi:hypothetical protein
LKNKEAADRLSIGDKSVRYNLGSIIKKPGVSGRMQLTGVRAETRARSKPSEALAASFQRLFVDIRVAPNH